ncbi:conserved protein of unknown function [Tepidanaerobacter acetatoxydans Re1]|uniref:Polysaccharide deacetylase n=1 Tax=Tepidanaerobacter acetatoxydans (strain DSM 21804 / JCM 16047 / Re1) TaxID=1209989 RepID=F4LX97_TEPAE|nr:DUF2334 domain-containing protein [Tepidanaerobacter acetatoxydans]AEE91896.1 hypothetical protein TepRe1_1765 [Tepidanaerobacter acetatoxydans Re1]CCP26717.1 conserved protein of unknown function [Tepidanaerobacter acetatoxydans Re1]
MYLIRLDDASEYMDITRWDKMEQILDLHNIKPIVGVIPNNQDNNLINKYKRDTGFWNKVKKWQEKGWTIALHGYNHVHLTDDGGVNPVNLRSEFAGVSLNEQRDKIANGIKIFKKYNINPEVFFAPFHTFDMNTLEALKVESNIRIVSDTIANDIYKSGDFYFIPQQSGHVQKLPFKVVTFCYHPNNMKDNNFKRLDFFIEENRDRFADFKELLFKDRKLDAYDKILRKSYFSLKSLRVKLKGK